MPMIFQITIQYCFERKVFFIETMHDDSHVEILAISGKLGEKLFVVSSNGIDAFNNFTNQPIKTKFVMMSDPFGYMDLSKVFRNIIEDNFVFAVKKWARNMLPDAQIFMTFQF